MFVKHIEEQNFFDAGFSLNPLFRETYSKQLTDAFVLSTYVQVWIDVNNYRYKAVTDKEGLVEMGSIKNKEDLREVNRKFFEEHKQEFLIRNLIPLVEKQIEMDEIQKVLAVALIRGAEEEELNRLIIKNFGDE